ncbi:hypothetical protein BV898_03631 [Hypsibius exemplaris]|uniref:Tudor domain-containing protein n=1 Tax=Hypsibius exemplaris TaxID=2072580 RepID=A0A1W0X4T3_HYPEX|nr:hypothetical protein BV898_03631 [Hypsibius exemplaris]
MDYLGKGHSTAIKTSNYPHQNGLNSGSGKNGNVAFEFHDPNGPRPPGFLPSLSPTPAESPRQPFDLQRIRHLRFTDPIFQPPLPQAPQTATTRHPHQNRFIPSGKAPGNEESERKRDEGERDFRGGPRHPHQNRFLPSGKAPRNEESERKRNEGERDFRGGPRGAAVALTTRTPTVIHQRYNVTGILQQDDDTFPPAYGEVGVTAADEEEFLQLQSLRLPKNNDHKRFHINQRVRVIPTALSMSDLTVGFHVYPCEDDSNCLRDVQLLRRRMQEVYHAKSRTGNFNNLREEDLVIGTLVAVNPPRSVWFYRGVIVDVSKANIEVFLLDVGIAVHLPSEQIAPLFRAFALGLPPLARTCRIAGLDVRDIAETHKKLKYLFAEAKRNSDCVEAVVCNILERHPRHPRHPNFSACRMWEVKLLINSLDITVLLDILREGGLTLVPAPIPPEVIVPLTERAVEETDYDPEHFFVKFEGSDEDSVHYGVLETYSF